MSDNISEIDKKLNAILGVDYVEEEQLTSSEIANIEPADIEVIEPIQSDLVLPEQIDQSDIDFEFARQNIKRLSDIGMENIEKLSYVARDSQTPRMYEVLSGMIKNISDINSNLVDMHNKKISSTSSHTEEPAPINVNQAIICTSTDALKRIKERKNNN